MSSVTRYPNSTYITSGCDPYGYDKVNDESDADYVRGIGAEYGYEKYGIASFGIPAGSTISSVTMYIRCRKTDGYHAMYGALQHSSTTNSKTFASSLTTSFVTYSQSWTTNPFRGAAWQPDDLNEVGSYTLDYLFVNPGYSGAGNVDWSSVKVIATYTAPPPPPLEYAAGGIGAGSAELDDAFIIGT